MMENTVSTSINSYLSFGLGDEVFAVNVEKVLEILEITHITKVPKSPQYMRGVINLRGSVLPVIDTRIKFGLPETPDTVDTCIVVLDILMDGESIKLGALVDHVSEVLEIDEEKTEPAPSLGLRYRSEFIAGMWKKEEAFIMLLNIDKVFSEDELLAVQESKGDQQLLQEPSTADRPSTENNSLTK